MQVMCWLLTGKRSIEVVVPVARVVDAHMLNDTFDEAVVRWRAGAGNKLRDRAWDDTNFLGVVCAQTRNNQGFLLHDVPSWSKGHG